MRFKSFLSSPVSASQAFIFWRFSLVSFWTDIMTGVFRTTKKGKGKAKEMQCKTLLLMIRQKRLSHGESHALCWDCDC